MLEALSLFSINSVDDDFSSFVRMADSTTIFFNGNVSEKPKVYVNEKHRIVIDTDREELSFVQQFERDGTSFEKVDLGHTFLDDSTDVYTKKSFKVGSTSNKLTEFGSSSIGHENELPEIKKYDFKKQVDYSGKEYYSLNVPNGSNLFRILSSNDNIRKEISELFKPYHLELLYDARLQEFQILKRTETGIFTIPYGLIADTLQRVIFYKTAIQSNKNSVLLFEEPETHMFPPYIRKLTADISLDENQNQFFIATHSPYILDDFILENQAELAVYIVDYKDGETKIHLLSDEELLEVRQYGVDLFYNLESYLQHGQSYHA